MCYLVREQQARAAEPGGATLPPSLDGLRPRWIGAAAAVLVGGLALAALVAPQSTSPTASLVSSRDSAAAAPLAIKVVATPTAGGAGQGAAPTDDGVPSPSDVVKAAAGNCHHGL